MFIKGAMFVHEICNKIPQLNFRRRLVLQQPVDFPVNAVNALRDQLKRAADIAQAQKMLRTAGQTEHRARHKLDALQTQPLPEQDGIHGVQDLHPEKHTARLLRIWQGQMPRIQDRLRHAVAIREMTRFGGVVSFEMGSFEEAKKVLNHVHLCALAVSLGDCETLIQHPASMTHSMCTKEEIEAAGFSDRLIRLAVGLEDPDDIIADLQQAFEAAQN